MEYSHTKSNRNINRTNNSRGALQRKRWMTDLFIIRIGTNRRRNQLFFYQVSENRLVSQPRDIIIDDHWRFRRCVLPCFKGPRISRICEKARKITGWWAGRRKRVKGLWVCTVEAGNRPASTCSFPWTVIGIIWCDFNTYLPMQKDY